MGARVARVIQTRPAETSDSDKCDTSDSDSEFDCSNMACINSTNDITLWYHVHMNHKRLCFCSSECYREWMSMPGVLSAWSPESVTGTDVPDPPPLKLNVEK